MTRSAASRIAEHLRPGMRVALADGAGAPTALAADLSEAAATVGDISLLLGWCLELPAGLDAGAFADVRTVMGGFALRDRVGDKSVRYVPERYSALPALLAGRLRPDVLVVAMARGDAGWQWGTEVAWMSGAVAAGATVLLQHNDALARTARTAALPLDRASVVARAEQAPWTAPPAAADDTTRAIGAAVADLIPAGARLQYGPGVIGDALCAALRVPVRIWSGIVTDAVLDLDRRGLVLEPPVAAYVVGGEELYRWADGRGITAGVELTHSPPADGTPFVAVNYAVEIDHYGQINVQEAEGRHISGVGGHPDFALAGHRCAGGLSIVAAPTTRRGRPTLVERLSGPASTPRSDVDVVVTELGVADLRGLDDDERRAELLRVFHHPEKGS